MKKSKEFIRLEEQYRALKDKGAINGEVLDFTESMFDILNKNEIRINEIEDRLLKLEDFSEILSIDLYDIQSALLKRINPNELTDDESNFEDLDEDDDIDPFAEPGYSKISSDEDQDSDERDDDEDMVFIRCPFCNTLIFIEDEESEDISCPFCGETFLKSDVSF